MNDPRRILVIDDEPDTLKTIFDLLGSEGFHVATAADGSEALQIVERDRPDLVICDMRMPGMDGMEVLARMARSAPGIKFIFLTAYGTPELYLQGLDVGARDMMLKPFKSDELLRVVHHLLDEATAER